MTQTSRRDFFKGAAAVAALGGLAARDALAHAAKPKPRPKDCRVSAAADGKPGKFMFRKRLTSC